MKLLDKLLHSAWEPFTPRGVVAFARARRWRLFIAQCLVAGFAAASVVWFLQTAWFPVVRAALHELPSEGEIKRGQLQWRGDSPAPLAAGHFLSFAVDLWHEGKLGNEAHFAVEFARSDVRVRTLAGYANYTYPSDWAFEFNQPKLEPWWGAWRAWLLAGAAGGTFVGVWASWILLATLYTPGLWLVGFFTNRALGWRDSWRLAAAALLPGAMFLTLNIFAYGLSTIDLIGLAWGLAFHFLIGWIYALSSLFLLPRHAEAAVQAKNPFADK
ncbi:MAG: hypothetical protein RLZZ350_443 [Verrucomicrobiota bacterium]|jgi:hypothetical protein